jgi:hypothetical protein
MKICVYCGKKLTGRKIKYCDEICQFKYKAKDYKTKKFSFSQHLRIKRAERLQKNKSWYYR